MPDYSNIVILREHVAGVGRVTNVAPCHLRGVTLVLTVLPLQVLKFNARGNAAKPVICWLGGVVCDYRRTFALPHIALPSKARKDGRRKGQLPALCSSNTVHMAVKPLLVALAALTLVNAQSASTCAAPSLQTAWEYELPVKNPGSDHGAPNVPQGKDWQGQPKKPKGFRKVKNVSSTWSCASQLSLKPPPRVCVISS